MKKRVFILGNQGNMAQRYTAVLKHLGHEVDGCDTGELPVTTECDAIIIATPTYLHLTHLNHYLYCRKPVLCEKPFINDPEAIGYLKYFLKMAQDARMQVSMVSQYDHLVDYAAEGETLYDYFRSGKDGIAWDCINIIKHAKGKIKLANTSPTWDCQINGVWLNQSDMDWAYVRMIKSWLENPYVPVYDDILNAHQKVLDYIDGKFD